METFSSIMKLKAFSPFQNAESALENLNAIKNNEISEDLNNFLNSNLKKKKSPYFIQATPSLCKTRIWPVSLLRSFPLNVPPMTSFLSFSEESEPTLPLSLSKKR